MLKPIIKKSISDAQLKNELIKLFEGGNTDKGKCREVLGSNYKIQVKRFYDCFNTVIIDWQQLKEKATAEQVDASTKEGLKSAVMNKSERQLFLTKIINGEVKFKKPFVIGGKIMEYPAEPDATDRLKAISELNKMDGDYAPTKITAQIESSIPVLINNPLIDTSNNGTK